MTRWQVWLWVARVVLHYIIRAVAMTTYAGLSR